MVQLQVRPNYIKDLENFTWGKDWRAIRLIKEARAKGDHYFAYVTRYYGEIEETDDYDVGNTKKEQAWIGRFEKFVGKRTTNLNPDSPDFGKRVYNPPVTEEVTEIINGIETTVTELVEGKVVYEYILAVNPENTKKVKELVGYIGLNQHTIFLLLEGARNPVAVNEAEFFNNNVRDYLSFNTKLINNDKNTKNNEKKNS